MARISKNWYLGRRAELLAEQFLLNLDPIQVSAIERDDIGFDFLASFSRGNKTSTIAVEVKAAENIEQHKFYFSHLEVEKLQNSNIPILLIVADVKQNRLY